MKKVLFFVGMILMYAVYVYAADLTVNGSVKAQMLCDELGNNCKTTVSIAPAGMIAPFYLSSCPSGWLAADGANNTPDLRGVFIRGLNNFGTGAMNPAQGDPYVQEIGTERALGDYQQDAFQGHIHYLRRNGNAANQYFGASNYLASMTNGGQIMGYGSANGENSAIVTPPKLDTSVAYNLLPRTATESRPRNVALIYCMKQ